MANHSAAAGPRNPLARYMHWLHTKWPAGTVEKLPEVNADGSTRVPGLYVVGDLTGIPLLKFSLDTGTKAVRTICEADDFEKARSAKDDGVRDLVIVGGGVSGFAAAKEAAQRGLDYVILEATEAFSTIVNFPRKKPIYTYPTEMEPAGELTVAADVKEALLDELREQTTAAGIEPQTATVSHIERDKNELKVVRDDGEPIRALRVIVAIGRSGNFRTLDVPGEELDKISNRLHDPAEFSGQDVLVVGGGDSALETAIALAEAGARVSLSYRKPEFSRPKPENIEKIEALAEKGSDDDAPPRDGAIKLLLGTDVTEIREDAVAIKRSKDESFEIKNDAVFLMIGREAPLDFFRKSSVPIAGEWTPTRLLSMSAFLLFCFWLYHWKTGKPIPLLGKIPGWLDPDPGVIFGALKNLGGPIADMIGNPATLLGTIAKSAAGATFWYSFLYSAVVVIFGVLRIRRRKTPYVKWQTISLMLIQVVPLFVIPEIVLPFLAANGAFDSGFGKSFADALFPGETWWRAYGLILAWPLMVANWFTAEPIWAWLIIGVVQTFVFIPALIYFWGKGAYCGWICSCGALAETLGDTHRHKMPHGPKWNRLNMTGQVILLVAVVLMVLRIFGWIAGSESWAAKGFDAVFDNQHSADYRWFVDILLAGVLGYGLYFWFSGRVWCRFACPLAALMHIYARFSRFRILADKKKCISCNVCTTVCHQGIDVMNFANKGQPMADPECVRCSACVQSCPTGVLQFGQVNPATGAEIRRDRLAASLVQLTENGRTID